MSITNKQLKDKQDFMIRKLICIEDKVDELIAVTNSDFPTDPMASAVGIDAFWAFEGVSANPLVLPNEPTFIYTFHRNGIEQNESQYDISGTSLTVYPALGSTNGGNPEILELRYKYLPE